MGCDSAATPQSAAICCVRVWTPVTIVHGMMATLLMKRWLETQNHLTRSWNFIISGWWKTLNINQTHDSWKLFLKSFFGDWFSRDCVALKTKKDFETERVSWAIVFFTTKHLRILESSYSMDWFCWENRNQKPCFCFFYHSLWGFPLFFSQRNPPFFENHNVNPGLSPPGTQQVSSNSWVMDEIPPKYADSWFGPPIHIQPCLMKIYEHSFGFTPRTEVVPSN